MQSALLFGIIFFLHNLGVVFSAKAAGIRRNYWTHPENIVVCWETPGWHQQKLNVQQAIADTWQKVSALRFTNWADCAQLTSSIIADIRIQIADVQPRSYIGQYLRNLRNGMKLNFEYKSYPNYTSVCQRRLDWCVRGAAVHEFGHAIGLAHEQNRPDAPSWCKNERQGTDPDHLITIYDPRSVMNYCNPIHNNGGVLSKGDVKGVRIVYGCSGSDFLCADASNCVQSSRKCDGKNDCDDGSDELQQYCGEKPSSCEGGFKCVGDGKCIWSKWKCDGDPDCDDGSDEKDCPSQIGSNLLISSLPCLLGCTPRLCSTDIFNMAAQIVQ